MQSTFRKHFEDDIARAESLLALAADSSPAMRTEELQRDVRLSAVAMAVGAMDAYFCDAYVDCLAARLTSYKVSGRELPDSYANRKLPTAALLRPGQEFRPNWALRMAARDVMERENVLDMDNAKGLFNPVLPKGMTLWADVMEPVIKLNWKRLTGSTWADYSSLESDKARAGARSEAAKKMKERLKSTIQYRHDWIHNCGRPKQAVASLTKGAASQRVGEIREIVRIVDDHLMTNRQL